MTAFSPSLMRTGGGKAVRPAWIHLRISQKQRSPSALRTGSVVDTWFCWDERSRDNMGSSTLQRVERPLSTRSCDNMRSSTLQRVVPFLV